MRAAPPRRYDAGRLQDNPGCFNSCNPGFPFMSSAPHAGPSPEYSPEALPPLDDIDEPVRVPLKIEDWLTVLVMGALALITFANVMARYFTNQSFAWTEEFSVFLMIVLALVGSSAAVARDRHIRIEYFSDSGSMARRKGLSRLGAVLVALLFTLIGVLSMPAGVGRLPLWRNLAGHRRAAVVVFDLAAGHFHRHRAARRGPVHPPRTPRMIATLLFVAFIAMMLVGVPIGAALGLAGAAAIALANARRAVVRPAGRAAELLRRPGQIPAAGHPDVRAGRLDLRPLGRRTAAGQLCRRHRRARPRHAAAGGDCGGDVPGRHFGLRPGHARRPWAA